VYKSEDVLRFMSDRQMPTKLDEMSITLEQFITAIRHGLNIMEKRSRYSILRHLDVDDSSLKRAIDDLGY
jgi:glycerol dehydrogenase-like iron-containing ADH family enzyme